VNLAWLVNLPRRTLVSIAAGVVLLAALVAGGWYWHMAEQRRTMDIYAVVLARLQAAQGPQAGPDAKAAALRDLESTLARFPSSPAAPEAAYQLATHRYDAGDYPGARRAYEIALAGRGGGTIAVLARAGIGYAWEAQRDYAKAAEAFTAALAPLSPRDFYYETLLVDLGRAQELGGRKSDAVATYQRALKEFPQGRQAEQVRARLLSLGAS